MYSVKSLLVCGVGLKWQARIKYSWLQSLSLCSCCPSCLGPPFAWRQIGVSLRDGLQLSGFRLGEVLDCRHCQGSNCIEKYSDLKWPLKDLSVVVSPGFGLSAEQPRRKLPWC